MYREMFISHHRAVLLCSACVYPVGDVRLFVALTRLETGFDVHPIIPTLITVISIGFLRVASKLEEHSALNRAWSDL